MSAERKAHSGYWAHLEERGVYFGLWLMLTSYKILGRFGFSLLLFPVIAYFFLVGRTTRRASIDFLRAVRATPQGQSVVPFEPGWLESFHHHLCFGDAILDKFLAWTGQIGLDSVDFENLEIFEDLRRSGRGGVLIVSHLGNAEVCRALGVHAQDLKMNVLVHTKHAKNFNRLLREQSEQSTVSLIETTEVGPDTAIALRKRVERGEFIVIVGDRTPASLSSRKSIVSFLGRPAPFPQGPFILAALMKCPVQLLFCLKEEGRFRIVFEPFCEEIKLPRTNRGTALDRLVAQYATRLEHHCVRVPFQWFNFFDFWGGADAFAPENTTSEQI